jgi:hypothetical protein
MKTKIIPVVVAFALLVSTSAWAQQPKVDPEKPPTAAKAKPTKDMATKDKAVKPQSPRPAETTAPLVAENTFEGCQDGKDNDGDGYIDCEDQDCLIFVMCLPKEPQIESKAPPPMAWNPPSEQGAQCGDGIDNDNNGLVDCDEPACATNAHCIPGPEEGRLCTDNKDNDGNGLIDCEEPSCQRTYYCRKQIYYTPFTPGRPMSWMVSLGLGLSLPNWSQPEAKGRVNDGGSVARVPFNARVGLALNLQVAYMPLTWVGAGVSTTLIGNWDSTRDPFDSDYTDYKYDAAKIQGGIGGFARVQIPVWERFVPFMNLHLGYTYSKYYWTVYPASNDWDDIDRNKYTARATPEYGIGHMSVMLEPGFDAFVRERSVAIGMRAQLPVATYKWRARTTDAVALFVSVSYTPTWRERPVMRPEYANPIPRHVAQPEPEKEKSPTETELAPPPPEKTETGANSDDTPSEPSDTGKE